MNLLEAIILHMPSCSSGSILGQINQCGCIGPYALKHTLPNCCWISATANPSVGGFLVDCANQCTIWLSNKHEIQEGQVLLLFHLKHEVSIKTVQICHKVLNNSECSSDPLASSNLQQPQVLLTEPF